MSDWVGSLEDRNAIALRQWKLRWRIYHLHAIELRDAWGPHERAFLTFSHARKLEAARSFLDRLHYLRAMARARSRR